MTEEWDKIVYDGLHRPKIKDVELEVHKIADQFWNKNRPISVIVSDYYRQCGISDYIDYNSVDELIEDKSDTNLPPILRRSDIEQALEFAEEHRDLIDDIIEEDQILKSILFDNIDNGNKIEEKLEDIDLEYYNINMSVEDNEYSINWGQ